MMIFNRLVAAGVLLVSVAALNFSMPAAAYAQSAPASDPTNAGDALSLRKTELARDQIIETVGCGRPGTGMPFFTRGAYDEVKCHGMNRQDAGAQMPPEGGTFLRPKDIEAVADYVIAHIKGAGEPTYAECVSFFSSTSRVCDVYKAQEQKPDQATASTGKSQ
jgi:hypothetical protein